MRTLKHCGRCETDKRLSEFGKKQSTTDGKQPWCKKCNQEYLTVWYAENKLPHREEIRKRKKAYRNAAVELVVEYFLDHPCIDCGEDDPVLLEFDHRDPLAKTFNVSNLSASVASLDFVTLRTEMDKCDSRCANCHRKKTMKERNYARYRICKEKKIIDY